MRLLYTGATIMHIVKTMPTSKRNAVFLWCVSVKHRITKTELRHYYCVNPEIVVQTKTYYAWAFREMSFLFCISIHNTYIRTADDNLSVFNVYQRKTSETEYMSLWWMVRYSARVITPVHLICNYFSFSYFVLRLISESLILWSQVLYILCSGNKKILLFVNTEIFWITSLGFFLNTWHCLARPSNSIKSSIVSYVITNILNF